jgi:hypothetical protein
MDESRLDAPYAQTADKSSGAQHLGERRKSMKDLVKSVVPGMKREKRSPDLEENEASSLTQRETEEDEMRDFFDQVTQIRQRLLVMQKNIDNISVLHSKTLTAISEREERRTREQLDQLMTETSLLAVEIRNSLKG